MPTRSKFTFAPSLVSSLILLAGLFVFAGCDSDDPSDPNPTEVFVRYELEGSCVGIQTVAYTLDGGGVGSGTFMLPWSFESDVTVSQDPTDPTAVALSAICQGDGSTMQSLLARILVDGNERGRRSAEGTTQLSVSVSIPLP